MRKRGVIGMFLTGSIMITLAGCGAASEPMESSSVMVYEKSGGSELEVGNSEPENAISAVSEDQGESEDFESVNLYEDDNMSLTLIGVRDGKALFTVENKLDQEIAYTNSSLSINGISYTDGAGLLYDSSYIAPKSVGQVATQIEYDKSEKIDSFTGSALYSTYDYSIDVKINFTFGDYNEQVLEGTEIYDSEYIRVCFVGVDSEKATFEVQNKLSEEIGYTNRTLAFDGKNYSDEAGLVYNTMYIAPLSAGRIITELEGGPDHASVLSGHAGFGDDDYSIDVEFDFSEVAVD